MKRDRLMAAFSMIGRAIDVDELSVLQRDTKPVRMRFQCRHPERIKGSVQVFVNGEGFTVGVQAERPPGGVPGGGVGGSPPPPPWDDRDDDFSDDLSSDKDWNKHGRRKKNNEKALEGSKGNAKAGSGPSGSKSPGANLGSWSAPLLGREQGQGNIVIGDGFNQYGSNLELYKERHASLVSVMENKERDNSVVDVELPGDGKKTMEVGEGSLLSTETGSQITDPVASWVEDSQVADGPPTKIAKVLGSPLWDPDGEAGGVSSEEAEVVVGRMMPVKDLLQEVVSVAPLAQGRSKAFTYTSRKKKAASSLPVRKSGRKVALAGTPIMELAQKRAQERNLESEGGTAKGRDLEGSGQTGGPETLGRGAGRG
jgi:hypothetical protein